MSAKCQKRTSDAAPANAYRLVFLLVWQSWRLTY